MQNIKLAPIKDLFQQFLGYENMLGHSEATIKNYSNNFRLLLDFKPDLELSDITESTMSEFFKYLDERERQVGRKKIVRRIMNSSRQTIVGKLKTFFTWLVDREYIGANPLDEVRISVKYTDFRAFTDKELDKIFLTVSRDIPWGNELIRKRNIAFIMLLTFTGVRRNELLHLKNSDFDWEERTIQIRAETSKSKMNRKVAMPDKLLPHLQAYKFERRDMKCEYFWISSNMDKRFTEHGLKHLTKKISEATKINCHVHRFRHTFAVKLYEQSKDILLVQRALGHTSIKMTLSYLRSKTDDEYIQQLLKLTAREFV